MSPDIVGWSASIVLIATLVKQIHTQAKQRDIRGVTRWLFVGQSLASAGFVAYSWLLQNWVFIVTNSLILLTALVGEFVFWNKKRASAKNDQVNGASVGKHANDLNTRGSPLDV